MKGISMNLEHKIRKCFDFQGFDNMKDIVEHDCPECREIEDFFKDKAWNQMYDREIECHIHSLSFLSPSAFRRFLPAFLIYSLKNPNSEVFHRLLFQLSPSCVYEGPILFKDDERNFDDNKGSGYDLLTSRKREFSEEETDLIVLILEHLNNHFEQLDDRITTEKIKKAVNYWGLKGRY
jgi:hypothetical protein